jgi:AcrR family transcriptional regulator
MPICMAMATLTRDAPTALLEGALRLFAEYGVSAVTVRQIAEASGQRNHAAVGYHFGSKEALVRAVIAHGARSIDDLRNALLDAAEAAGGLRRVIDITRLMIRSSLPDAGPPWSECYNRFIVALQMSNRALVMDALEDRWNSGYLRCQDHLRRLKPEVPPAEMNRRLLFMGAALGGILAGRERELADHSRPHPMWTDPATLEDAAWALAAMVERRAS